MKRLEIAKDILCAFLSNPERYKYISGLFHENAITQEEATAKNVNKAIMIADALIARERETAQVEREGSEVKGGKDA